MIAFAVTGSLVLVASCCPARTATLSAQDSVATKFQETVIKVFWRRACFQPLVCSSGETNPPRPRTQEGPRAGEERSPRVWSGQASEPIFPNQCQNTGQNRRIYSFNQSPDESGSRAGTPQRRLHGRSTFGSKGGNLDGEGCSDESLERARERGDKRKGQIKGGGEWKREKE